MKYVFIFVIGLVANSALAADEFGARFSDTAPAALGREPQTVDPALSPEAIEPAAGAASSNSTKIPEKIEYGSADPASEANMAGAAKPLTAPAAPQELQ